MNPYPLRLTVFLTAATIFRLCFAASLELTPDEAYYWGWSRHLQGGYFDHPPMVAAWIALTTWVGGSSELFVRLAAVIPGLGLSLIAYFLGRDLFQSEKAGYYGALWLNLILIISLGSVIITPDTPLIFFYALTLYFLFQAIFNDKPRFWYFAGLSLGCSLLSKYTGILAVPCLALFLIFSYRHKRLLRQKEPYLALAIAGLVFSPTIIWNASNHWISLKFQFSHGLAGKQVDSLNSFLEYLGVQALVVGPFVFAVIAMAMVYCYKFWVEEREDRFLFLLAFSLPIYLFFLLVSFKSKVEGNWPAIAYFPAALALAGLYVTRGGREKAASGKAFCFVKRAAAVTGVLLVVAAHLQGMFRVIPLPLKSDIFAKRAYGWERLGQYAGQFLRSSGSSPETFVFADRHQIVSELSFYLPGQPQTYRVHGLKRYSYLGDLNRLRGKNGLYVFVEGRGNLALVESHFDSVKELQPLPIKLKGQLVKTFRLFLCKNYKGGLVEI